MRSLSLAVLFLSIVIPCIAAAPFKFNVSIPTVYIDKRSNDNAHLTWYDITTGPTACGGRYSNNDYVVALSAQQFGDGYPGPNCGREIRITANGRTQNARVVDRCTDCSYADLDLTKGLFSVFANPNDGVVIGSWDFV